MGVCSQIKSVQLVVKSFDDSCSFQIENNTYMQWQVGLKLTLQRNAAQLIEEESRMGNGSQ